MLISLIVVTISQRIHISNHHIVHVKYIQILFVNYTSIKLDESINKYCQGLEEPVQSLAKESLCQYVQHIIYRKEKYIFS